MKKIFFIIILNLGLLGGQLWTVANFGDGGQKWAVSQKKVQELKVENEKLKQKILAESTMESLAKKAERMGLLKIRVEYAKLPAVAQKLE